MAKGTPSKPGTASGAKKASPDKAAAPSASSSDAPAPVPSSTAKPAAAPKPAAPKKGKGKEKAAAPPPPVPYEEHARLLAEQQTLLEQAQSALSSLQSASEQAVADLSAREQSLQSDIAAKEAIITHLEAKAVEQSDRIAELKDDAVRALAEVDSILADGQQKIREEETRIRGEMEGMKGEMEGMRGKLDELEEFRMRKVDMERELKELKEELARKEIEYREGLRDLEVKSQRDKAFVKKQATDMVSDAIAAFKDVAEKQLSESTKHAMRENQMLDSQLRLLSAKFSKILPINDSLRAKIKLLKTELSLSGDRERILMGRQKKRDEVIKILAEKLRDCDGLLVKMVEEVEKLVADGAVLRRRESTGRGSFSAAGGLEPVTISIVQDGAKDATRPVSPQMALALPGSPVQAVSATIAFTPTVAGQRELVSRTLASVLSYSADETPLPSPSTAFGMGTLAEEQDEENDAELWSTPEAQVRSKREMSMTVVESLASVFRGKLDKLTGGETATAEQAAPPAANTVDGS